MHGYSRSFTFWFTAKKLDLNGFVVDFSSLRPLENKLKEQFDHTFLVNKDDPLLNHWEKLHDLDALDLRIMDNVGMEFTSELIWRWANEYLQVKDEGRTCCWKTESKENKSNKASYEEIPDWFKA
ncbi:Queuosine biosynthesis QueD [Prochlorococcus marinus str. MIT 9201]|uniref:6-carboxy-5,6,7,8-tetrahydropterin synthase n=1 Tax=Prochlorococcus marinus str. MIT 9201 TaxID=93057 RepID=A0A0A2A0D7_PROMR|nr:Queuosine biosynthesis QueD [Prochlorococcus marinus str. MIT 9201]